MCLVLKDISLTVIGRTHVKPDGYWSAYSATLAINASAPSSRLFISSYRAGKLINGLYVSSSEAIRFTAYYYSSWPVL